MFPAAPPAKKKLYCVCLTIISNASIGTLQNGRPKLWAQTVVEAKVKQSYIHEIASARVAQLSCYRRRSTANLCRRARRGPPKAHSKAPLHTYIYIYGSVSLIL